MIKVYTYDDGIAEGKAETKIELICRKIAKGKELSQIADELEDDEDSIREIYDAALGFAPDFDVEKIYNSLYGKKKEEPIEIRNEC